MVASRDDAHRRRIAEWVRSSTVESPPTTVATSPVHPATDCRAGSVPSTPLKLPPNKEVYTPEVVDHVKKKKITNTML